MSIMKITPVYQLSRHLLRLLLNFAPSKTPVSVRVVSESELITLQCVAFSLVRGVLFRPLVASRDLEKGTV